MSYERKRSKSYGAKRRSGGYSKYRKGYISRSLATRLLAATYANRPELKSLDTAQTGQAIDNAGDIFYMSAIAEGSTNQNRTGIRIQLKSIDLRVEYAVAPTATVGTLDWLRFVLFQDLQQSGSTPTISEVLTNTTTNSGFNKFNRERFRILMDKEIQGVVNSNNPMCSGQFRHYVKRDCPMKYIGPNAGDAGEGAIYLLVLSQSAPAASSSFSYFCRLRFTDA